MDMSPEPSRSPSRKEEILTASPLRHLAGTARASILEVGTVEALSPRRQLIVQDEAVKTLVLLHRGRVRLERKHAQRGCFVIGHLGPGEIVGESGLSAGTATETATVVDGGEGLLLPLAAVRKLMSSDSQVRSAFAKVMLETIETTQARLASLLIENVERRLVRFVLASAHRWGAEHSAGTVIKAAFTHADIALSIGSTRETVTLLLGKLKRAELIGFERRRIVIRDRDALARRGEDA
jgi:CRP/FNR family transcriptional regulator, cyclic AMP receptor protein